MSKLLEDRLAEWAGEMPDRANPHYDLLREAERELRRLRTDLAWYHKDRDRLIWEATHWPKMMDEGKPR